MICPTCGEKMKLIGGPNDSRDVRLRRYQCTKCPTRVTSEEKVIAVDAEKLPIGRPWHRGER